MNGLFSVDQYQLALAGALLLTKITLLLGVAWCMHGLLQRANPRWKVLLWRLVGCGLLLMVGLAVCPPIFSWAVLPPGVTSPAPSLVRWTPTEPDSVGEGEAASTNSPDDAVAANVVPFSADGMSQAAEPLPGGGTLCELAFGVTLATIVWFVTAAVWLAGVVGLLLWMCVGAFWLRGVVRRSRPAPAWIAELGEHLQETLGYRRSLALRITKEIATPCLVGIWRPVVLLPEQHAVHSHREELPAILFHETAHLAARDQSWNAAFHVLAILLWPHPLAWRICRAHAIACETVADAVAAGRVGDVAFYIHTLARLTVQMHRPVLGAAMAMGHGSSILHRIRTLQRRLFPEHLPRGRTVAVAVLMVVGMVLLGGVSLTEAAIDLHAVAHLLADAAASESADTGRLTVYATQAETGEPMEGVTFLFEGDIDGERIRQESQTDGRGIATLSWRPGAKIESAQATWNANGFVSQHYDWRTGRHTSIRLPQRLHLEFQPSRTIGGIVKDESGQPVEGARVEAFLPVTWPPRPGRYFLADWTSSMEDRGKQSLITDANGRWQWDGAPDDLRQVDLHVHCPGYLDSSSDGSETFDALCVLARGQTVHGRIVDAEDHPVENATVRLKACQDMNGSAQETRTDGAGQFVFPSSRPGSAVMTVQCSGFVPQLREVVIDRKEDLGRFQLQPVRVVRIRVVDHGGEPIRGVTCRPKRWRCCLGIKADLVTDADGRVQWPGGPEDAMVWSFSKPGCVPVTATPADFSGERLITLAPSPNPDRQVASD